MESAGRLKTWRLNTPPEDGPFTAEEIGDHRMIYLDYEGAVSDNRGEVTIHSKGTYRIERGRLILTGGPSEGIYPWSSNAALQG